MGANLHLKLLGNSIERLCESLLNNYSERGILCLVCFLEILNHDFLIIPILEALVIAMVRLSPFGRGGALVHTMVLADVYVNSRFN